MTIGRGATLVGAALLVGGASPIQATPPVRTLADVPIEGEVPVPEVLFISGRDSWRTLDFENERYLPTALEICGGAELPRGVWLLIVPADFETTGLK
jgi:hypothetical protein